MQSRIEKSSYETYKTHLLRGDKVECGHIVEGLLERDTDVKDIYINLFQRSMYQVGELWEYNRITVAVEHLATSITQQLMNLVYPRMFAREKIGKKAVIAGVANEYHQLGSQMVSDIFELNGWDGYFLGANTPINDLMEFIDDKEPDVLGLSLAIYFNMPVLKKTVDAVRSSYPRLPILVGGQAFAWGGQEITGTYEHVAYLPSIAQLEQGISDGRIAKI